MFLRYIKLIIILTLVIIITSFFVGIGFVIVLATAILIPILNLFVPAGNYYHYSSRKESVAGVIDAEYEIISREEVKEKE